MAQVEVDLEADDILEELDLELLGSSNSVHDRTQFESKFDFDLTVEQQERASKSYEVDLYMFVPQTMGINADTYNNADFYSDLTHLLRIRTPELKRAPGAPASAPDKHEPLFEVPPLVSLDEYFANHLNTWKRKSLQKRVVHDIKLFGCLIYTELKKLQTDIVRVLRRARHTGREELIGRFHERLVRRVESIHREIRVYRDRYIWKMQSEPLLLDAPVRRSLLLVDEYLSYRLESTLVEIHRLLESHRAQVDSLLDQIEALLTGELAYRTDRIPGAGGPEEGRSERRHYRLGLLKKFVSDILFLETKRVKRDQVYRNLNAAVGASLAALFAAITNVPSVKMWGGSEDLGFRVFTVLLLGVAAYAFKDRIKELSKEYFNAKLKSKLPDFDVMMYYTHFDKEGNAAQTYLGSSQEYTRYLSRSGLAPDVSYVRAMDHVEDVDPERLESVLHYHKKVTFELKQNLSETFGGARVRRLHDVLRLNVRRFLAKLDNPRKTYSYYEPENGIVTVEVPKIYHVNLVFRYTVTHLINNRPQSRRVEYERIRMILNKKGIVRLEKVVPRGQLGYDEENLGRGDQPYDLLFSQVYPGPLRPRMRGNRKP